MNTTHTETILMQKAEEARINMFSLQESHAMYFLDGLIQMAVHQTVLIDI